MFDVYRGNTGTCGEARGWTVYLGMVYYWSREAWFYWSREAWFYWSRSLEPGSSGPSLVLAVRAWF